MKFGFRLTAILSGFLLLASGAGFADDAMIQSMQDQIKALNQQLSGVESRLASVADQMATKPGIDHPGHMMPSAEGQGGLLKAAEDIQIQGHIDVQYNQNLTRRDNAIAGGNTGRIFDTDRESFTVNQAELDFIREANPEGGAGFRIDIAMGEDAGVVAADGFAGDNFDLQQAYIEYVQPLSFWEGNDILPSSINLKAGRFVTLAGLEVIEPQDNWNISRSYAFGLSIPFVHTGVRTNFKLWKDFFDVYVGVNNGWGAPVDGNEGKTWEFGLGYSVLENVSLFHAIYFGNENTGADGSNTGGGRFLSTNVITIDATDKLSFMAEFNVGNQNKAVTPALPKTNAEGAQWYSWNLYARYQATAKDALAYRFEYYRDDQAFSTALSSNLFAHTLTYERKLADNLISRAEYRYDHGAASPFASEANMQTITAEMIYLI